MQKSARMFYWLAITKIDLCIPFFLEIDYCEEFCYNNSISFTFDKRVKHSLTEFYSVICILQMALFLFLVNLFVHKADRP